jgi:hypothetical protein
VARWVFVCLSVFLLIGLIGCSRASSETTTAADPDRAYFEKVRAGAYQLSVTAASLATAVDASTAAEAVAPKSGEIHEALLDAKDYLDSCGSAVSDFSGEPPAFGTYKAEMKEHKTELADSLQASCDAYIDLNEAIGCVDAVVDGASPKLKPKLEAYLDAMTTAQDDLGAAIEAFGGKIPDTDSGNEGDDGSDAAPSQ